MSVERARGVLTAYYPDKRYGFISAGGAGYFYRPGNLSADVDPDYEAARGDTMEFTPSRNDRGPLAIDVVPLNEAEAMADAARPKAPDYRIGRIQVTPKGRIRVQLDGGGMLQISSRYRNEFFGGEKVVVSDNGGFVRRRSGRLGER